MPKQIIVAEELYELRLKGWSLSRCARHFKISRTAIYKYLKRHKSSLCGQCVPELEIGICEICGEDGLVDRDHDHKTNLDRGILCRRCNLGLGQFRDNLEFLRAAIRYLERRSSVDSATRRFPEK